MRFFARFRIFSPSASLFAWLVALGFAAWVAAELFWRFAAPRPEIFPVSVESDAGRAAQVIAGRHFMGEAAAVAVRSDAGRFALFGVLTGDEARPGFAVLAVDGGAARGVVAGQEVVPGVVLARIFADHAELRSNAGTQDVPLSSPVVNGSSAVANRGPSAPPSEMSAPQPAVTQPPAPGS